MKRGLPGLWLALAAPGLLGCAVRLTDPIFSLQEIRAAEPTRAGKSLLFGTIAVASWLSGDLDSVTFKKLGAGANGRYYETNRVNVFRVFFRRAMKNGNFVLEVDPGLYELNGFSTSGWGSSIHWTPRDDARPLTRILVTRPGIYDLGTLHIERPNIVSGFGLRRTTQVTSERQAVLVGAVAGTTWSRFLPTQSASETLPGRASPQAHRQSWVVVPLADLR